MKAGRRQLAVAVLGLTLSLVACGTPLEPTSDPDGSDSPSQVLRNAGTWAFLVEDATDRIVLAMDPAIERDLLAGALRTLQNTLQNGTVLRVRKALGSAEAALTRYADRAPSDGASEAELDAIKLALEAIAADLANFWND